MAGQGLKKGVYLPHEDVAMGGVSGPGEARMPASRRRSRAPGNPLHQYEAARLRYRTSRYLGVGYYMNREPASTMISAG